MVVFENAEGNFNDNVKMEVRNYTKPKGRRKRKKTGKCAESKKENLVVLKK